MTLPANDLPTGWGRALLPAGLAEPLGPIHGEPLLSDREAPANRPYVAVNFVVTLDGRVTVGGSPEGLGSPSDQHLMRRLRAEADALLHGAGTLRSDRFSPRVPEALAEARERAGIPRQPVGVLVAGRGPVLADHPYFTRAASEWPRWIYTVNPGWRQLERDGISVMATGGDDALDLAAVLADLRARGIARLVCEGGPRLFAGLLRAALVDELFLTLAPVIAGGADPLGLVAGGLPRPLPVRLVSLYARGDELFARYRVGT